MPYFTAGTTTPRQLTARVIRHTVETSAGCCAGGAGPVVNVKGDRMRKISCQERDTPNHELGCADGNR